MNEINYYWGIPDASVSFCENKYDNIFGLLNTTILYLHYVMLSWGY